MIYTATVNQYATQSPDYEEIITFNAATVEELNELFDIWADEGPVDPRIALDDSKKPEGFDDSGGFCSRLISFTDESGNDLRHLVEDGIF